MNKPITTQELVDNQIKVSFNNNIPKMKSRYVIPKTEQREMFRTLSPSAYILFSLYVERSTGIYNGNALSLSDDVMSLELGWTTRKVAKYRRELSDNHYFLARQYKATDRMKSKAQIIYLGKGAVSRNLIDSKSKLISTYVSTEYELQLTEETLLQ